MAQVLRRDPNPTQRNPDRTAPVVKCGCGAEVFCGDSWANSCDNCGTEFNGSGQTLAPRAQWGEETGEVF